MVVVDVQAARSHPVASAVSRDRVESGSRAVWMAQSDGRSRFRRRNAMPLLQQAGHASGEHWWGEELP